LTTTPVELHLEWHVSAHARRLSYLALAGLGLAVATRRAELVAFAAPALVFLGTWRAPRPQSVRVSLRLSEVRFYEGERVAVEATVEGHGDHDVEVLLHPSGDVQTVGSRDEDGLHGPGGTGLAFRVNRWGHQAPGVIEVTMRDRWGVFECRGFTSLPRVVCYPRPARHRRARALGRLTSRSGDHPARSPGEGVEFIGVRQYAPGDRQRSINWAATTRRGRLQVNTYAAERSQDIVLVVDALSEVGQPGSTSLDYALRGALGVARTYLDARDRVGIVSFGKRLLWLSPGMGNRQFSRLLEGVLEIVPGWSPDGDVTRVPRTALPPGASVIAFSPLLDTELVEALRDLRQRSFSVVVVDVLNVEPGGGRSKLDRLARRVSRMERQALMFSLEELAIPVVAWDGEEPLALPVEHHGRPVARSRH
jgi:uncharacterized protein (DUF58 family)